MEYMALQVGSRTHGISLLAGRHSLHSPQNPLLPHRYLLDHRAPLHIAICSTTGLHSPSPNPMRPIGGSTPERRERRRTEQSSEPEAAAAAVSIALVLGNSDLLAEILLRVGSPVWLVRAALASKSWLRVASDPSFLARFRARNPPRILGVMNRGINLFHRLFRVPQPPELATAARLAGLTVGNISTDNRCHDYCNGCLLIEVKNTMGNTLRYVVRSVLDQTRLRILPPPPPLGSATAEAGLLYSDRMFLLEDTTSCLYLTMACNAARVRSYFSILRSGVWGAQRSAVRDLQQVPSLTALGHKLLSGNKLYMLTPVESYILALDLATATFSVLELPDGAKHCTSIKFSRAKDSGVYLICVTGYLLSVWRGDGTGQWVLVDTIPVREACAHLNVPIWDVEDSSPVWVAGVGDNAEFIILELVASGMICYMQLSNRVVEKVFDGAVLMRRDFFLRPISMVWPPFLPIPPPPPGPST